MPEFANPLAQMVEESIEKSQKNHKRALKWATTIARLQINMIMLNPRVEKWIYEVNKGMPSED